MTVFKTLNIRQQRTAVPERHDKNNLSSMITLLLWAELCPQNSFVEAHSKILQNSSVENRIIGEERKK